MKNTFKNNRNHTFKQVINCLVYTVFFVLLLKDAENSTGRLLCFLTNLFL